MSGNDRKPGDRRVARREAQPLRWSCPEDPSRELSEEQRRAAKQACGIMRDLAERDWKARDARTKESAYDRFLAPIDPERRNHVVLLDGPRGSGKTALLITLVNGGRWSISASRSSVRGLRVMT